MRLRRWTGTRFVCRAPNRGGGYVPLRVAALTPEHVLWWQAEIQPVIDRDPTRADNGWNWLLVAPFTFLAGTAITHGPAGYCVGIVDEESEDGFVPCALLTLVGRMRALDDHRKRSAFVWFLTTAPEAALRRLESPPMGRDDVPKRLGTIALDVAVTHSFNTGRRGLVALHAAPEGGERLLAWYRKQGMTALQEGKRLPRGFRRLIAPNDGRYCYFTKRAAEQASRRLDDLRKEA